MRPVLQSADVIYTMEIPNMRVDGLGEFPKQILRLSLLINDTLYLNVSDGLVMVDIYEHQWRILRKFTGDTIIVDFNVSMDRKYIIYSLLTNYGNIFSYNCSGILYGEEWSSGKSDILYSARNKLFHSLYWLDNNRITFIEWRFGSVVGQLSGPYSIFFSFSECLNIIKIDDKKVQFIGHGGPFLLNVYNDTLIVWCFDTFEIRENWDFPLQFLRISDRALKPSKVFLHTLQPIPQFGPAIYHYKVQGENIIRFLNLSTGKEYKYFAGDFDTYAISSTKNFLMRVRNRYQNSLWSWGKHFITIDIIKIPPNLHSVISDSLK